MATYDDIRTFEAFEELMQEPPGPTWHNRYGAKTHAFENQLSGAPEDYLPPIRPIRSPGLPWFEQLDPSRIPELVEDTWDDGVNARRQPEFIPGTHRRIRITANGDEHVHVIIRVGSRKVMI